MSKFFIVDRNLALRGRSLAWIRRQPPELVFPGSNPGGPAILFSKPNRL